MERVYLITIYLVWQFITGENSGTQYDSYKESIEDFCKWVMKNVSNSETIAQAKKFETVNNKFIGTPENNIYVLFCRYMHLGDTHLSDEPDFNNPAGDKYYNEHGSNWGSGGRIYLYHMYELGALYKGEYAERCGHSKGTDLTTLQERADYVQYSIEKRLKIAKNIFGNEVFVGNKDFANGEGHYESSNGDLDYHGIYTSSSGRTYIEWRQTPDNKYGQLELFTDGYIMGRKGCNVYAATILLNSIGLDVNPGDVHSVYIKNTEKRGNIPWTINKILNSSVTKSISTYDKYLEILKAGLGVMTYVTDKDGNGEFTKDVHWIVVADIRETQLGSKKGYDVFIVNPNRRGRGWYKIETILSNLQNSNSYGLYIEGF